jgi:hypothetical protein
VKLRETEYTPESDRHREIVVKDATIFWNDPRIAGVVKFNG